MPYRLISNIAYATFCIYLFHRPIYEGLMLLYFPENPIFQIIYLVCLGLPVIVMIAWMIQKSYDRSMKCLKKRWRIFG